MRKSFLQTWKFEVTTNIVELSKIVIETSQELRRTPWYIKKETEDAFVLSLIDYCTATIDKKTRKVSIVVDKIANSQFTGLFANKSSGIAAGFYFINRANKCFAPKLKAAEDKIFPESPISNESPINENPDKLKIQKIPHIIANTSLGQKGLRFKGNTSST